MTAAVYTEGKIERIDNDCIYFNDLRLSFRFNEKASILALRDALLEKYPLDNEVRTCELCDEPGTTIAQDELGNDCWVCDEHSEKLASRSLARQADEHYDQTHKSGDE